MDGGNGNGVERARPTERKRTIDRLFAHTNNRFIFVACGRVGGQTAVVGAK